MCELLIAAAERARRKKSGQLPTGEGRCWDLDLIGNDGEHSAWNPC